MRKLLLLSFTFLFLKIAQTQTHQPRSVNINGNCKGFYEYLPQGYAQSSSNFPLLIYCGGAGTFGNGTSSQLSKMLTEGPSYFIQNNQFPTSFTVNGQTASFIVISPQFVAWPTANDVEAVISHILNQGYKVDQSRIYLAGFSAGGDVTWKYPSSSLARSKKIAALVPVAPFINPYTDAGANNIANGGLPVWALHSNADQTAPSYWSQNYVNKVNSYNPSIPAIITRTSTPAHDPSKNYFFNPGFRVNGRNVYEWMLQYRRNYPPNAVAGQDVLITLPVNSVNLNAAGSSDPEGSSLSYLWKKISGPSAYSLSNSNAQQAILSNLVAGQYQIELQVADSDGYFDRDTVKVTVVNPNQNNPPVAHAGNDQTISLPQNSVILDGNASSDQGGSIEQYTWTQFSGPTAANLSQANSVTSTASNLKKGVYVFRLTIVDNEGGSHSDEVQITVLNPFPNAAPVANAGNDQSITLPSNSVTVNGAASSDADGFIVSYQWSQVSGPNLATISQPGNVSTSISNLVQGLYRFQLTVTDDSSATGSDLIDITVLPAPSIVNRYVRVNLFGGSNPYTQDGWNNWNVTGSTNLVSSNFNYSDGASSTVNAVLSYTQGIGDNGSGYGGTMCPPQVLRYTSYSTASTRTITIRGLNNSLQYDLEFYASRANSGNSTRFIINGVGHTIITDNNKTEKAVFVDVSPVNGQIVVNVNKASGTYSYVNGFVLIEKTVSQPAGMAPEAKAGNDITIQLPIHSVSLDGSLSTDQDGSISSYNWVKIAGPTSYTFSQANAAVNTVSNLTAGTYRFVLTVTDNTGMTDKDTIQVNVLPLVVAQTEDSINCQKPFTIVVIGSSTSYGTGASPIDSSWVNKYADYALGKNQQINIINLGVPSVTTYQVLCPTGFVPPANRPSPEPNRNITKALSYQPDAIIINMPSNDIAMAYAHQEIKDNYERTMSLTDSAGIPVWVTTTQPRSTLSPSERGELMQIRDWTIQRFGEKTLDFWTSVADSTGAIVQMYDAGDGIHVNNAGHHLFFTRVVSARVLDSLCIRNNMAPFSLAGPDRNIVYPKDSVHLNGSGSYDLDGSIISYTWSQVSGASCNILQPSASATAITGLTIGNYQFELMVKDEMGGSGKDTVEVIVEAPGPIAPVAHAGDDVILHLPANSIQLDASGSQDADGTVVSFQWSLVSGPEDFSISNPAVVNPTVSGLTNGLYTIELIVTDNDNLIDKDTLLIYVNKLPVADAGSDVAITLPANSVSLSGSGTDEDGSIVAYKWAKYDGPSGISFSNVNGSATTVSNLQKGVYILELTVTDNLGGMTRDYVTVTVHGIPNVAPQARAGNDQSITLPTNSAVLSGSNSTDSDGQIITYSWLQIEGPSVATLSNSSNVNTTASGLMEGMYRFELTVTDDSSASGRDTVEIQVLPVPPVTTKYVRVNLFGGSNPYNASDWNNWNVSGTTNITSSNFNYSDGTSSTINAVLSYSQGVPDNGAGYGGTMCPPQVLRYTSYSTAHTRNLTIRGLNNNATYDLEFYASRITTGNSTSFVVNGNSATVVTDNNKTDKAILTGLVPVNGQLVVAINKTGTFTYINGFTLTEHASTVQNRGGSNETVQTSNQRSTPEEVWQLYPNPANQFAQLVANNDEKGLVTIHILDAGGRMLRQYIGRKGESAFTITLDLNALQGGLYFIQVMINDKQEILKLFRKP